MDTIDLNSVTDMVFQLKWKSRNASHLECYSAGGVNLWRDWLPERVQAAVVGQPNWSKISVDFTPNELFGGDGAPLTIDRRQFSRQPRTGRFYPKGRLSGLAGVFPQNIQPFRCVGINNGSMTVDLSHPLAPYPLSLSVTLGRRDAKTDERGGASVDWLGMLTEGPGMQARWQGNPTDFFGGEPLSRKDEGPDDRFYQNPRLVHHLDETARDMLTDVYRRFVKDGMQVLDLMSSWTSHLPEDVSPATVTGLGMNRTELEQNPRLTDLRVHDLNRDPTLPFADRTYDLVTCTVSVEYLTRPLAVFAEVARVLKPGGVFVVTFSNRWFPPKVVNVWEGLHEFERVGLVMEYFLKTDAFGNLGTYSMRGLPRPQDDKYAGEQLLSDPVYAVWGTRTDR
jgi:SAM-dependent methyltransferase